MGAAGRKMVKCAGSDNLEVEMEGRAAEVYGDVRLDCRSRVVDRRDAALKGDVGGVGKSGEGLA